MFKKAGMFGVRSLAMRHQEAAHRAVFQIGEVEAGLGRWHAEVRDACNVRAPQRASRAVHFASGDVEDPPLAFRNGKGLSEGAGRQGETSQGHGGLADETAPVCACVHNPSVLPSI